MHAIVVCAYKVRSCEISLFVIGQMMYVNSTRKLLLQSNSPLFPRLSNVKKYRRIELRSEVLAFLLNYNDEDIPGYSGFAFVLCGHTVA